MTEYEWEQGLDQIRQLQAKVAKLRLMTDHPNYMPGVFRETPPDIPYPSKARLQWGATRIFLGSAGAAVTFVCLSLAVMLTLVQS